MRAADAVDDGWALAASCSDVRKSSSSKMAPRGAVRAWCACELWRTAIAPKVSKRVKGADGAISERDGDGALFGAAVDVLEALAASYDAVRPHAGPANVLVRGADDGFVSLAIPLEAVRDAYTAPAESRLTVLAALARSLVAGLSISVDAAGVADLFGDIDLDLEHAASDAEVAAAAEAEKTLAVALSNPAAADALRAKRAEQAGAELADELASEEVELEDARDAESDDNWSSSPPLCSSPKCVNGVCKQETSAADPRGGRRRRRTTTPRSTDENAGARAKERDGRAGRHRSHGRSASRRSASLTPRPAGTRHGIVVPRGGARPFCRCGPNGSAPGASV